MARAPIQVEPGSGPDARIGGRRPVLPRRHNRESASPATVKLQSDLGAKLGASIPSRFPVRGHTHGASLDSSVVILQARLWGPAVRSPLRQADASLSTSGAKPPRQGNVMYIQRVESKKDSIIGLQKPYYRYKIASNWSVSAMRSSSCPGRSDGAPWGLPAALSARSASGRG